MHLCTYALNTYIIYIIHITYITHIPTERLCIFLYFLVYFITNNKFTNCTSMIESSIGMIKINLVGFSALLY